MKYKYEYTDTYCGETNYCWVKRGEVEANSLHLALRRARKELGLTGLRGKIVGSFGDAIHWKPTDMATILIVYVEY